MNKPVILCVDDEPTILDSLKIQLKKEFQDNYLYEAAENANEALEIIEELQDNEISVLVIISDWLMPGMKGDDFLIKVHKCFPNIVKIMLTGQVNKSSINKAEQYADLYCCLHKPWNNQELIETIKSGIKKG
ncbi:MAG TPA: hypothetical protein DCF68_04670 [Cyanothece sp. UBA12306]|nr:hypothetical protein [Cyanothece sp. UBA12306]